MMTFRTALLVCALAFGAAACTVRGRVGGQVVASSDPMLVELYPGVWVIEDYNEPVFYADGFYWWYRNDGWYRSSYHTGGWVYVRSAPSVIVRIDRPRAYVRYRATAGVRVRSGPRGTIIVRDHRNAPRAQPQPPRDEMRAPRSDDRVIRPGDRAPRPDDRATPPAHPQQQADRRDPGGDKPAKGDDKPDKDKPRKGDNQGKDKPDDKGVPKRP